jgi:hypothetical protein
MTATRVIPSLCALVVFAAEASAQRLAVPQRRDSAGVTIVEYETIKTSIPAFTIDRRPMSDVGGLRDDPNDEIESTGFDVAVRFADGKIAVAENYTVRVLNAAGKFVRLLGARGGGPGEFNSQIVAMCLVRGDTLIVRDGSRRIAIFDSAGRHVLSSTAEADALGGCLSDGTMVAQARQGRGSGRGAGGAPPPTDRQYATLVKLDRTGKAVDTIGKFPSYLGMAFGIVQQIFAVAPQGDRVIVDNANRPEVKIYSLTGKLAMIIRWRDPVMRVTPELAEGLANARVPLNDPNRKRSVEQMLAMPYPPTLPVYSGFFVDREQRIWVRDPFPLPGATEWKLAWTIFTADGTLLGRYEPPADLVGRKMVTDAGKDFVVVRVYDREQGVRVLTQAVSLARGDR